MEAALLQYVNSITITWFVAVGGRLAMP